MKWVGQQTMRQTTTHNSFYYGLLGLSLTCAYFHREGALDESSSLASSLFLVNDAVCLFFSSSSYCLSTSFIRMLDT